MRVESREGATDVGEGEVIVLIDFDVAQSFGHAGGQSGKWVMHPVIEATDVTFGGHVLARLQLDTSVVLPQIGGQTITLASVTARLTPAAGLNTTFDTTLPLSVEVVAKETTTATTVTVTAASAS
jgi:hypothetical protein